MKKMIRNIATLVLLLMVGLSFAQHPVKWTASVEQTNDAEATLVFKAKIEKGWHMYSQFTPDGGPQATVFTYDKSNN